MTRTLQVRHPNHHFSTTTTPHYWAGGDPFGTQLLNAFSMIFPSGERYLLRPMLEAASALGDPELIGLVRGFAGQESQHAVEHQRSLAILRAQGYAPDAFVERLDRTLRRLEKHLSRRANLAFIAAVEHVATTIGDLFLRKKIGEQCPRELASLFEWHAMEELEHRSVAFEVMVRSGGGYLDRALGLTAAVISLIYLFTRAMYGLARRDAQFRWGPFLKSAVSFLFGGTGWDLRFFGSLARYFLPGFHPDQDAHAEAFMLYETRSSKTA